MLNKYVDGIGNTPLVQPSRSEFSSLLTFLDDDQWVYFFCLACAVVLFLAARNLMNSRTGRAMIATRDHELAAATVGVNLAATKVGTFAISAAYAGLAGSLSVMVDGQAVGNNPSLYFQRRSSSWLPWSSGAPPRSSARWSAPSCSSCCAAAPRASSRARRSSRRPSSAPALILIMYVLPEGIVGGVRRLMARLGRPSRRRAPPTPSVWPPPDAAGG